MRRHRIGFQPDHCENQSKHITEGGGLLWGRGAPRLRRVCLRVQFMQILKNGKDNCKRGNFNRSPKSGHRHDGIKAEEDLKAPHRYHHPRQRRVK